MYLLFDLWQISFYFATKFKHESSREYFVFISRISSELETRCTAILFAEEFSSQEVTGRRNINFEQLTEGIISDEESAVKHHA